MICSTCFGKACFQTKRQGGKDTTMKLIVALRFEIGIKRIRRTWKQFHTQRELPIG